MLLTYSLIIILIVVLTITILLYFKAKDYYRVNDEKQRKTIALLKMQTIRNRMSPHFFFNALSGLSGEAVDAQTTKTNIKALLMLLRKSVENTEQLAIPISEELEVVKGYIDLMKPRISEPFEVTYDIGQEIPMNFVVPAMILQIPVENALKHGLLPLNDDKNLTIKIHSYNGGLQLQVEDNGIGYRSSPNRSMGAGTGLKILYQTIALLNSINSDKIEFTVNDKSSENQYGRGTIVQIQIPGNYSYEL